MPGNLQSSGDWIYQSTKKAVGKSCKGAVGLTGSAVRAADRLSGGKVKDATGVVVATATAKAAVVPTLGWFGFSTTGPVAGTWATTLMASYGAAVPTGSLCSIFQSVAMGGTAVGLAYPAAAVTTSYLAVKGVQKWRSRNAPAQSKL